MNTKELVLIEVSDMAHYMEWDNHSGLAGCAQVWTEEGIVVHVSDKKSFTKHIKEFETIKNC